MTDPIIERARQFARRAHEGQLRKDGAPYIAHPERVAQLLMRYHYDDEVVAAGWLHDVVEDCGVQLSEIEQLFGKRVASLVDAVTENPALEVRERKKDRKLRAANGPDGARAIAVADSIDNLTDLVKFHAIAGNAMWASWKGLIRNRSWRMIKKT